MFEDIVHCREIRAKRAFWGRKVGITRQSVMGGLYV